MIMCATKKRFNAQLPFKQTDYAWLKQKHGQYRGTVQQGKYMDVREPISQVLRPLKHNTQSGKQKAGHV